MRRAMLLLTGVLVIALLSGCGSSTPVISRTPEPATPAVSSPTITAGPDPVTDDLAYVDSQVRALHPNPFAINSEAAWVAKLAELRRSLPAAAPHERIVQIAGLMGLLDTHSSVVSDAFQFYNVLAYPFADGWFVIRAQDPSLVGLRLISVGGNPISEVEAALRPLVPSDNESGELDGLERVLPIVEYLHGLGIVEDPARPAFVFEAAGGTERTVDVGSSPNEPSWEAGLKIIGGLMGDSPEAVAKRGTLAWTRLDEATKTFMIAYNDYSELNVAPAIAAMTAALDNGSATRVLLDMRYLRGGNGSLSDPLVAALAQEVRVNRPGGLIVMIGRENVSAGTVLARNLDEQTQATFVGEMTPARADGFLCECSDIRLASLGLTVDVPTFTFGNGDTRQAIEPDVPFALTAADFFAGKDPALVAALALK